VEALHPSSDREPGTRSVFERSSAPAFFGVETTAGHLGALNRHTTFDLQEAQMRHPRVIAMLVSRS
jgi:hypothetical protein